MRTAIKLHDSTHNGGNYASNLIGDFFSDLLVIDSDAADSAL